MTIATELITLFIAILAIMTLAFVVLGAVQRERRALSWIFAGMFGFMAALTAIVTFLIVRTLPQ